MVICKNLKVANEKSNARDNVRIIGCSDGNGMCKTFLNLTQSTPEDLINVPLEGYLIIGFDYSNIVIQHPIGFKFRIGHNSVNRLLITAKINSGKIEGKCIIGFIGYSICLISDNDPEYAALMAAEVTGVEGKVLLKDLKPGMRVITDTGGDGIYLGRYNTIIPTQKWMNRNYLYLIEEDKKPTYFVLIGDLNKPAEQKILTYRHPCFIKRYDGQMSERECFLRAFHTKKNMTPSPMPFADDYTLRLDRVSYTTGRFRKKLVDKTEQLINTYPNAVRIYEVSENLKIGESSDSVYIGTAGVEKIWLNE